MEKLIELLNEYGEYDLVEHKGNICKRDTDDEGEINIYTDYTNNIISKKFGFVKWLVDNDKIDLKEFHRLCGIINQDSEYWNGTPQDYEQVIMYLSISDYPIEDLISILK